MTASRSDTAGANVAARGWRAIPAGVWTLGFVSLFMDLSSEMIHALLPVYLVSVLGATALAVGVVEGVAEATGQITRIFSGVLSDRLGKRKLLAALGYGLSACTKPIFPLAGSVGWIVAARFADRVGKGIRGAPRDALVADITPPALRGAGFGLRQSLDTVGAFLGPLVAIALMWLTRDHFTAVFWVAVIPACIAAGLIALAVQEPAPQVTTSQATTSQNGARTDPAAPTQTMTGLGGIGVACWVVIGVSAVFTLARFSEAFLVLRAQADGVPLALIPAVLVAMNIAYALSAFPAGMLSDRLDRATMLAAGLGALIIADLVLALVPGLTGLGGGVLLWGLHMGFTQGLLAALVADTAPAERRGTAFGLFHLTAGLAQLAASVLAGALWDVQGPDATFLAGAALAALSLLLLLALRGRMRPPSPEAQA